jgi:E3 SUMO-protein ligase PIAS1
VRDILTKTSRDVEQVTIEPDGAWSEHNRTAQSNGYGDGFGSDDDDDLIEIKDSRVTDVQKLGTPVASPAIRTSTISSREPSATVGPSKNNSAKRPSAVIDLTLSDDDDDEPIRPAKRQQMLNSFSSPGLTLPTGHP